MHKDKTRDFDTKIYNNSNEIPLLCITISKNAMLMRKDGSVDKLLSVSVLLSITGLYAIVFYLSTQIHIL